LLLDHAVLLAARIFTPCAAMMGCGRNFIALFQFQLMRYQTVLF